MDKLLLIIIAIFIPPLAVYLHQNACNNQTLLNLLLTIIGFYVVGLIHALWIILK
jgi:uncharacterized membrane protein YqaE (UPF0057 family)